jgi:hypothetical protein
MERIQPLITLIGMIDEEGENGSHPSDERISHLFQ